MTVPNNERRARRALSILALASSLAFAPSPGVARADTTPQDRAVAQSLYDDARALMSAGTFAAACPKLEESQRLDPAPATLFHLADCYEHVGRTASAWAAYLDVAAISKRNGRAEREQVARDKANALLPKLSKLAIDVPASSQAPGIIVKRDGSVVREGQWGTPVPVDSGKHVVDAAAPGKLPWHGEIAVTEEGKSANVSVPKLEDAPPEAVAATPAPVGPSTSAPPAPVTHSSTQKILAVAAAGAGVVGLGLGSVFGLQALSKNSDSNASGHCANDVCDGPGKQSRDDARSAGTLSTIGFVAGGVLLAGGAVLWFTAPSGEGVRVSPTVGLGAGGSYGASLDARF